MKTAIGSDGEIAGVDGLRGTDRHILTGTDRHRQAQIGTDRHI